MNLTQMGSRNWRRWLSTFAIFGFVSAGAADGEAKRPANVAEKPTYENIAYGAHERQKLDFWQAPSTQPTPVLFFIHGGGWIRGDKSLFGDGNVRPYRSAGISVVAINYRFVADAHAAGVKPPVEWPLRDAARALQFVRSKASEWNIDKNRIATSGSSAGACSGLWLALSDDMANPGSDDPIARESTRLTCAAVYKAQTSLDPRQMQEWIPNINYGAHAFGVYKSANGNSTPDFEGFLAQRERLLPWIEQYSPYAQASSDDPPIYLNYKAPPVVGQPDKETAHSANFGVALQTRLREVGVECELVYPGAANVKHQDALEFIVEKLKAR